MVLFVFFSSKFCCILETCTLETTFPKMLASKNLNIGTKNHSSVHVTPIEDFYSAHYGVWDTPNQLRNYFAPPISPAADEADKNIEVSDGEAAEIYNADAEV